MSYSGIYVDGRGASLSGRRLFFGLHDLIDHKEQYYGKTVTVEGEMHRIFTDRVFTIEDDDLLKDDDVLVISNVPRAQAVVALQNSIDPGKNVL